MNQAQAAGRRRGAVALAASAVAAGGALVVGLAMAPGSPSAGSPPPSSPTAQPARPTPRIPSTQGVDFRATSAATPPERCRQILRNEGGVLIIGDSLTVAATRELLGELDRRGIPACVNAKNGRTSEQGVAVLRTAIQDGTLGPTTRVVMALGTNDGAFGPGRGTCQATTALSLLRERQSMTWLTGYRADTPKRQQNVHAFAVEVSRLGGEESRLHVLEWGPLAANEHGLLLPDQTHHTPEGRRRWVHALADALDHAPKPSSDPGTTIPRCANAPSPASPDASAGVAGTR